MSDDWADYQANDLLDFMQQLEEDESYHGGCPTCSARYGNALSQIAFKEAYEGDLDDQLAVDFTEEVFSPLLKYQLGEGMKPEIDFDHWRKRFNGIESTSKSFHMPLEKRDWYETLLKTTRTVERDAYDKLVGIYSGGIAALYGAEIKLDAVPVVMRFSHLNENDEEVQITENMKERADFEDDRVLILDDVFESGKTFRETGEFLRDEGADTIHALAMYSNGQLLQDFEVIDLIRRKLK